MNTIVPQELHALCCNIPISIGSMLAAWLAAQAFSQALSVCFIVRKKVAGSCLTPPALFCKIYYSHIMRYISVVR